MKLFNNGMRKSTEERVERKGFYIICILFLFFSFSPLQFLKIKMSEKKNFIILTGVTTTSLEEGEWM